MTHTRTALVIGGGIAGPVTALALRKAGIDATVYEAHPSAADGIGAFLTLAPNGLDALRVLGVDGSALTGGFPTPGIVLRNRAGKRLGYSRTGSPRPDAPASRTIKRADLYRFLRDEAQGRGVPVEYGKRLVRAEQSRERVRAVFADGTEAVADVLIGCDGVYSTVRRVIDGNAPAPTYTGLITTGGYARGVPVDSGAGCYEMIFGRRAFFGYAVAPDGEVWWFANVPRRREPARGEVEAIGAEEWRRRLVELYAGDAGPAIPLIRATEQMMAMTPIHAIPRLPVWHAGRMIVTGDAAHAPSPSSGQGASLSIEDAVVLAQCLRDLDPAEAFARFEAARRPRVERIIKAAARVNNSKAAGRVASVFRDAMLPLILKLMTDSSAQREIYDYRIDWDATAAVTRAARFQATG